MSARRRKQEIRARPARVLALYRGPEPGTHAWVEVPDADLLLRIFSKRGEESEELGLPGTLEDCGALIIATPAVRDGKQPDLAKIRAALERVISEEASR